jgi:hypothetical protein
MIVRDRRIEKTGGVARTASGIKKTVIRQQATSTVITTPTTPVLGAGASMPFGYPCGLSLLEEATQAKMRRL